MYTTTLDVNKNYKQEVLKHGVILVKNEQDITFNPEDFLQFSKSAINGNIVANMGCGKLDGDLPGMPSPGVIRVAKDGLLGPARELPWHSDISFRTPLFCKKCITEVAYNKDNAQSLPTKFIDTTKILAEVFDNDVEYLKSIQIHYNFKKLHQRMSNQDQKITDKKKLGWVWDIPDIFINFSKKEKQAEEYYSPIVYHPILNIPVLNLSTTSIEDISDIDNDKKGLYTSVIQKLISHDKELENKFEEESTWKEKDMLMWDNFQVIHSRKHDWCYDKRELWRILLLI